MAEEFFDDYRLAFTRDDIDALIGCFAFPLHTVSITADPPAISVSSREDWLPVLRELLAAYRTLDVADALRLEMDLSRPIPGVVAARVHWGLRRSDGSRVYEFTALYTLVQTSGALRIVAIAHDEVARLREAMAAR